MTLVPKEVKQAKKYIATNKTEGTEIMSTIADSAVEASFSAVFSASEASTTFNSSMNSFKCFSKIAVMRGIEKRLSATTVTPKIVT
jgi:hypothetical protein